MSEIDVNKFDIFPWNKNFETGIDHVDEQHKKLVEILNRLAVNLAHRSSTIILDSVFNELVEYTDYHFKAEENYWNEHLANDPWSIQHNKTHNSFIEKVLQLKNQKTDKNSDQIVQEIVAFLTHWLAYHILDSDKRMSYVAKQIIQGSTIEEAKNYADNAMSGMMKTLIDTVLNMYDSLSVRTLDLMREKALRKQAEQALLASEERWNFIVKGSEDSIWEWNINDEKVGGSINNSSFFKFLIQNDDNNNMLENNNIVKIHSEDIKRVNESLQNHLDGATAFFASKYRVLLKNNSWSWINSKGKVVERNSNGEAIRIVGTHTDVTERELGSLIFKQSYQSVIITDTHYDIKNVNPVFLETTGFNDSEIYGQNFFFWFSEKNKNENIVNIKKEIKEHGIWTGEILGQKKNGQVFTALTNILPINKVNESFNYFVIMFTDISERKEMEKKLLKAKESAEESDRLKSAFLANMSHEIRTPMNGILGFAGLLKTIDLKSEKQQEYIEIIEKSGDRMLNVINQIMDISKIESGQMQVLIENVDVNECLEDSCAFFMPEAAKKNIELRLANVLNFNETKIKTDLTKLNSILFNLIKNAIKYTNQGSVEFGCSLNNSKNEIEFYIKDTGIGIPKNRQTAIFERFIQADIEDRMAKQGAGLGLTISKAYVNMLKGKLWLESEENKGSTFYFTLPYKNDLISQNGSLESVVCTQKQPNNLKILIVEDDEFSGELLTLILSEFAEKIINAKNGNEAIEACKHNPDIDLILMDIQMPDINGYEATKQIRKFNNKVIIVAQTAFALAGDKEKSIAAGCNDYISKPIKKDQLMLLIQKYFL
ncbi:response regulator [Lutibacter sp. HS1-25]|uniref:bacteriohemerythrin n=1 Tax=Lutibacter sp. HS1-25 TaxID=2485000 RepID=UPI001012F2A0|nr:bacteriohemerythrin [Lutibacter sp. HS1-25]RXP46493.1 response regulator [Lutibacter sp. HS1-25]